MSGQPNGNRVLLVEGVDEKHVVWHLRSRDQLMPSFDFEAKDGFRISSAQSVPRCKFPAGPFWASW